MAAPIEEPLTGQMDLFGNDNPQQESLAAGSYDQFLNAMCAMQCACCRVGPTNGGAPPVVCKGNPKGRILLIGEAPGMKEREMNLPFVGPAGAMLDTFLLNSGIPERAFFFMHVLKCRSYDRIYNKEDVTQVQLKDRTPSEDEVKACFPLLRKQLTYTSPAYVILLGKTAATACLGLRPAFVVLDNIGAGVPVRLGGVNKALAIVVPHPSYFLYNKRAETHYARTLEVFQAINCALTMGKPMTYHLLPEEVFLARSKPLYYERRAMACA